MNAYVEEELTRRGIEQGRYRLLRKPFPPEDLATAVGELLGAGSAVHGHARVTGRNPDAGVSRN